MKQAHHLTEDKFGRLFCSKCGRRGPCRKPCPFKSAREIKAETELIKAEAEVEFLNRNLAANILTTQLGFVAIIPFIFVIYYGQDRISKFIFDTKDHLTVQFNSVVFTCNQSGWLRAIRLLVNSPFRNAHHG